MSKPDHERYRRLWSPDRGGAGRIQSDESATRLVTQRAVKVPLWNQVQSNGQSQESNGMKLEGVWAGTELSRAEPGS